MLSEGETMKTNSIKIKDFLRQNFEEIILEIILNKEMPGSSIVKLLEDMGEIEKKHPITIIAQFNCSNIIISCTEVTLFLNLSFWDEIFQQVFSLLKTYEKDIKCECTCLSLVSSHSFLG